MIARLRMNPCNYYYTTLRHWQQILVAIFPKVLRSASSKTAFFKHSQFPVLLSFLALKNFFPSFLVTYTRPLDSKLDPLPS